MLQRRTMGGYTVAQVPPHTLAGRSLDASGIKGNKVSVPAPSTWLFSPGAGSVDCGVSAVIPPGTGEASGSHTHCLAFLILCIIPCSDCGLKTTLTQAQIITLAYLQTEISSGFGAGSAAWEQ